MKSLPDTNNCTRENSFPLLPLPLLQEKTQEAQNSTKLEQLCCRSQKHSKISQNLQQQMEEICSLLCRCFAAILTLDLVGSVNRKVVKFRCIAVNWDQSAEGSEVAALEIPHSGNPKTLETGITGSLGKANRFVCKILSSPRNTLRYNNENSLKNTGDGGMEK